MIDLLQQFLNISSSEQLFTLDVDSFQSSHLHIFWKDTAGAYLGCTDKLAKCLGFDQGKDLISCTDYDLTWAASAPLFRLNDNQVMASRKPKVAIESGKLVNGKEGKAFSYKLPLKLPNKKMGGIICIAIQFDNDDLFPTLLTDNVQSASHLNFSSLDLIASSPLTKRQKECLYYLSKGMSIKQIANQLTLSARTVEHYLETIKEKLGCHSRAQLIAKVIET